MVSSLKQVVTVPLRIFLTGVTLVILVVLVVVVVLVFFLHLVVLLLIFIIIMRSMPLASLMSSRKPQVSIKSQS